MNELLARLSALFLEPAAAAATSAAAPRRASAADQRVLAAVSVVVVGDGAAARVGLTLAAALARAARTPLALLCTSSAPVALTLPPLPAAARAAAKLRARGHDARANGRVVVVLVADDAAEPARAAATVDAPLVTAWCGARPAGADNFDHHDLALVVTTDELLGAVAAERVAARHPALRIAHVPVGPAGRFAPPPRAAVRVAMEALR